MSQTDRLRQERLRYVCENAYDIQAALRRVGIEQVFRDLASEVKVSSAILAIGEALRLDQNIRWNGTSARGALADAHRGPAFRVELKFECPNDGRRHCSRTMAWEPNESEQLPQCDLSGLEFRWDGHERLVS